MVRRAIPIAARKPLNDGQPWPAREAATQNLLTAFAAQYEHLKRLHQDMPREPRMQSRACAIHP